jgi:hypothetical protein
VNSLKTESVPTALRGLAFPRQKMKVQPTAGNRTNEPTRVSPQHPPGGKTCIEDDYRKKEKLVGFAPMKQRAERTSQLPSASGFASYRTHPAITERPSARSFGCVRPSLTGTSAKSNGLMPSIQATFTPY